MASANRLLSRKIRREDVRARFAGLQAEVGVRGLDAGRGFAVVTEFNNMFTVVGGSMTLYRAKAETAIDAAIARHMLPKYGCMTRSMRLDGSSQMAMEELQKSFLRAKRLRRMRSCSSMRSLPDTLMKRAHARPMIFSGVACGSARSMQHAPKCSSP